MRQTLRLLPLFLTLACAAPARAEWTHDAYVWRRQNNAQVDAALRTSCDIVHEYCVLASEIAWRDGVPSVARPRLDYGKLAALKKPIGLALRIGTLSSQKQFAGALPHIAAEAAAILETARAAGLDPAELQIDFDCPESKLALYRNWLVALKTVTGKTPLTFTALPCWLNHEEDFAGLAREAGGFVLQVHSLEKPEYIDCVFTLCDPDDALRWSRLADELAERAGTRFRIALPTYGYTLGFDRKGRFAGLAAEAPRDWPAGTQLRTIRANPRTMQTLATQLAGKSLARADGIIWFRLPVDGDRLAWNAETLDAVIKNKKIVTQLVAEIHRTQPGLAEIIVINRGQTAEPLPQSVRVTWTNGQEYTACDGIGGFYFYCDNPDRNTLIGTRTLAPSELAPGRSRAIGWVRFDFSKDKAPENFSIHATIP